MEPIRLAGQGLNVAAASADLALRCPACGQRGTFDPVHVDVHDIDVGGLGFILGQRKCPNPECLAHVFVVLNRSKRTKAIASYPPEVIDFDSTALPDGVRGTLQEALMAHAHGLHRSAAMMIRRTLEALCADKGAKGSDLKARLKALGEEIVVPKALLVGMDELRLLGNDAAHIESRDYDEMGDEQVRLAIEVTKELLKATYQYAELVERLSRLKTVSKSTTT